MEPRRDAARTTTEIDPFSSATAMLAAMRTGAISAVELLDMHLQRLERFNGRLNAVVILNADAAQISARMADDARARGEDGPLLGVPVTIKDCIFVRGLPATGGLQEREAAVQVDDARVVSHLRAAGAVLLGKTNVPPYASDWQADNPVFGRSNNPWNLDYTPGGSTGGGAAAVAAGLSPLELGGDFCGSIRIPAAFCGVYGHKPSSSAVAGTGHFPDGLLPNAATSPIAVLGPLARDPVDLELALNAVSGPEVGEDRAWRLDLPDARAERLGDFRVAVLPSISWQPVDDEINAKLAELTARLAVAGATVAEAQPEALGDLRDFVRAYVAVIAAISSLRLTPDERHWQAERCRALGDELLDAWADGLELSGQDYIELFDKREQYRAALRSFFDDWDVLVAPANIVNAFRHMDSPFPDRLMDEDCRLDVNGESVVYDRQAVYPSLASFTGHPATAFPIGPGASGLPVGLQAIGPYLEDRTCIAFTRAVAREIGGYTPPPGYH